MKQTALQKAIDKIEKLEKIDHVINPLGVVKGILISLLPYEMEVIEEAYNSGDYAVYSGQTAKDYYTLTFESDESKSEKKG